MKDLIIILAIVIIVFGGNIVSARFLKKSGKEILDILDDMKENIKTVTDEEKDKKIEEVKNEWDSKQKVWITLQYHEIINQMEDVLIECYNYYKAGKEVEFNINLDKFKRAVEDLENREKISFVNVL